MPTVTSQVRAQIGGMPGEAPPSPRRSITANTGSIKFPVKPNAVPAAPEVPGQVDTKEETAPQAVTLSPQLTALARKQQKLQGEIQAQRDKEMAWEKTKANYVPKAELQAKLQQNAAEALKDALGMDYNELTQLLLNQQQGDDPVKRLESKLERLEKSQEENVNKQFDATVKQYRAETDALVASDPKAYHFIAKGKASGEWGEECPITTHIIDTWKEDPDKILTVEQAAKEIEEILRDDAKSKAALLKELEPPAEVTTEPVKKTLPPPQRTAPRTLTSQVEASPSRTSAQFQHMSMKERIAEASRRAQR